MEIYAIMFTGIACLISAGLYVWYAIRDLVELDALAQVRKRSKASRHLANAAFVVLVIIGPIVCSIECIGTVELGGRKLSEAFYDLALGLAVVSMVLFFGAFLHCKVRKAIMAKIRKEVP